MDVANLPEPKLRVPKADLGHLSACPTDSDKVAEWVGNLPMANTATTTEQLMSMAAEIARVQTDYLTRFSLLENIRPTVHYLCTRLDRQGFRQNEEVVDPIEQAQTLQLDLCAGYKAVVMGALPVIGEDKSAKDLIVKAAHRTISDLSRTLVRSLRRHAQPPRRLWLELNQLFLLCEQLEVDEVGIRDAQNHSVETTTVANAYKRALLLAASQPYQLSSQQLQQLFNALEDWSQRVALTEGVGDALFAIDLDRDGGPSYSKLERKLDNPRGLHSQVLAFELESFLKELHGDIPVPDYIDNNLLVHVANVWSVSATRAQLRIKAEEPVELCAGLLASHHLLIDRVKDRIETDGRDQRANPFIQTFADNDTGYQKRERDLWNDTRRMPVADPKLDTHAMLARTAQNQRDRKPIQVQLHQAITRNVSPSGYQLVWPADDAPRLQAGEIISLREGEEDDWRIGTLRWVRRVADGTTQTGVELLSPKATPVSARVVKTIAGASDYARSLLLPEVAAIDQPATLITPRFPFQSRQKVHIRLPMSRGGRHMTAQLETCLRSTSSFNQFTFRMLGSYLENL